MAYRIIRLLSSFSSRLRGFLHDREVPKEWAEWIERQGASEGEVVLLSQGNRLGVNVVLEKTIAASLCTPCSRKLIDWTFRPRQSLRMVEWRYWLSVVRELKPEMLRRYNQAKRIIRTVGNWQWNRLGWKAWAVCKKRGTTNGGWKEAFHLHWH